MLFVLTKRVIYVALAIIVVCFRVILNLDNAKDTLEKETVNNELIVGILVIKATSHDVLI